ncbi:hypothetical protein FHS21_001335 [Phyllobacterium trifolii]|uniref:Uncharacterized protein n=1 Tax=Phyllobacterium trifolii TaxID=300193 RepID=A0A839U4G2_9HYPH|nr:hypothetical protein [Phyllobacterium trifolii]MBB3144934.1 hypothetical protein [Phyllobacterium trifolii]
MYDRETIKGHTEGYHVGAIFELSNGQVWQQTSDEYEYIYQFMPDVLLDVSGFIGRLRINDMNDWVSVKRIR